MKGFQVEHLPRGTHTFLSNSCWYCRTKTSQDAMLYLRLEMRSWLFSRTSQMDTATEGKTFHTMVSWRRISIYPSFTHRGKSVSWAATRGVSIQSVCSFSWELGADFRVEWLSGAGSPFSLRLLGWLQPFRTSQQSQNLPELQDCFPPVAHSLGNENPHPSSPCQEPSWRFPCMSHWPN